MPSLSKPTKSVYKSLGRRSYVWNWHDELTSERVLSLLCIVLLPISLGLYGASVTRNDLTHSSGDGFAIWSARMGYGTACFTEMDSSGNILGDEICATITQPDCKIEWPQAAIDFQQQNYGFFDAQLGNCTEFNGYRATVVMAIIFAGFAVIAMILAHLKVLSPRLTLKLKIFALVTSFLSGSSGVIAQCVFTDWWNFQQSNLIFLNFYQFEQTGASSSSNVLLAQAYFDLAGGWVCALTSSLLYIIHFPAVVTAK